MIGARQYPSLVLNADFRPLSYFPLSLLSWREAIKAVFLERVSVVAEYPQVAHSPSRAIALPSVVSLHRYVPPAPRAAFTRFNVFLRDGFTCQYCKARLPSESLTFDHVIPRSRGGVSSWSNVVTACQDCNLRKGSRLPQECGMVPQQKPYRPSSADLQKVGLRLPQGYLHESWRDFLYWDSELEK